MLYGSQQNCTEMLPCDRSHQLGKGQSQCAGMSLLTRPSRPVYGSQPSVAAMPLQIRSQGKGHHRIAEMPSTGTPFPPVLGGSEETHSNVTGIALSHQLGKGIICTLIKPLLFLPFLLIYGSRYRYAAMSFRGRSHQF